MSKDTFNRRSILKRIGGAAAGSMAIAASGTASAENRRIKSQYTERESLLDAFRKHARDLPTALAEAGVVTEEFGFDRLDFEVDPEATRVQPSDDDGVAGVTVAQAEGPRSALGMISTSTDAHDISLYVQPQREKSYAIVEPNDEDEDDFVVSDDGDVTTLGCVYTSCTCERCDNPNGVGYYIEESYRCNTNCSDCVVDGTSCQCTSWC